MAARLIVLSLAVFAAGLAAIDLNDTGDCEDGAKRIAVYAFSGREPVSDGFLDEFAERCRGSQRLAMAADALLTQDRLDQAARLADEAIRREPDNHAGWVALSRTLRAQGNDAAADRAMARARRLNPRFGSEPG